MSNILSQSEIEALLNSLTDEEGKGDASGPTAGASSSDPNKVFANLDNLVNVAGTGSKSAVAYELYDFRRPDKFSKDQLRTMQMLHETFARVAATGLSAYLRSPVSIDLISLEQVPYEEYLRSINTSVFTVMSLPPLSGQAVLELEFQLIFTMVDRLLGGPGRSIHRTNLSDIEKPLVRQMIERMFSALKTAWEGIVILNPGIETMETSAQFVQISPPNDIVVTILFEVKIGNSRGAMSICVPYLVLKPITAKLSAQKWFVNNSRKNAGISRKLLAYHTRQAPIDCAVELGKAKISMRDMLELKVGDVVSLDQKKDEDLIMRIQKNPKFTVSPSHRGKQMIFTVTDTIENL
ncbi:MAG: flagellar motor switch protein FliM [Chthonomonas sp.]|nr:flagellar motor switch protein FliM [Chthonomonas sp.]